MGPVSVIRIVCPPTLSHLALTVFSVPDPPALTPALKPVAADKGVKLTFMPFFLKAASLALTEYPMINSQLNPVRALAFTLAYRILARTSC